MTAVNRRVRVNLRDEISLQTVTELALRWGFQAMASVAKVSARDRRMFVL